MQITIVTPHNNEVILSEVIKPLATSNATSTTNVSKDTVSTFSETLASESQKYKNLSSVISLEDIFREASETYQVDYNLLISMAKQESNFDPNSTSSSGAMGIMQLMPETAADLGVTSPYDPYENIMGGAKYIRQMLDRYDGNTTLALAAYNAGSGNVAKYGGVPPFAETQNYIKKITGYMETGVTLPETNIIRPDATKDEITEDIITLYQRLSGSGKQSFLNMLHEANQ